MYATTSTYVPLNIATQNQQQHYGIPNSNSSASIIDMRKQSCGRTISPAQFSFRSGASFVLDINGTNSSIDTNSITGQVFEESFPQTSINLQIFVPELQMQKCLTVNLDEIIWDIKLKLFDVLPQKFQQYFNYGFFLPPCDGRAGKFLLEDRPIRDYPFHDCVPYVELKYKKRVYKTLTLDEKTVKNLHSKSNLKKFMEYVLNRNAEKIEKMCQQGIDPNFFDSNGETPLTRAAIVPNNSAVIVQLAGGGAHLDYRNSDGQTALHKSAFSSIFENVKALIELGASPNYRDSLGLTPLYYNMLKPETNSQVAELLLTEAADICVVDHYANNPLHQACKNGLIKQVELLLFYGANINAQNVNGNTPLHVCAVNNRVDCAQTLLFRGADFSILNKNGQTAVHVAHIVNNTAVADVIQRHNPESIVPFCDTPKFNTRRRVASSQLTRRRSISHCSINSAQSERFQLNLRPQMHPVNVLSNLNKTAVNNGTSSNYGTLKKNPVDIVPPHIATVEPNIPRVLVIPRGPKGFGFILRGANQIDSRGLAFEPTPIVPALQFFEGVETTGMAMRAGLKPGDYLLEINGVDVRCANHEEVVNLINHSEDTISLKVITIDPYVNSQSNSNYNYVTTVDSMRRNHSVPRNTILNLPPAPPQRNSATMLSSNKSTMSGNNGYATMNFSTLSNSIDHYAYGKQQLRCASVKSRPSPSRRISAAELEHLMIRQSANDACTDVSSSSQIQSSFLTYNQNSLKSNNVPKKFTSIAEMKRRKQQNNNAGVSLQRINFHTNSNFNTINRQSAYEISKNYNEELNNDYKNCKKQNFLLKSFDSSPNLAHISKNEAFNATCIENNENNENNENSLNSENSENIENKSDVANNLSNRYVLRPKTPPPPPPSTNFTTKLKRSPMYFEDKEIYTFSTIVNNESKELQNNNLNNDKDLNMVEPVNYNRVLVNYVNQNIEDKTIVDLKNPVPPPPPPPPNFLNLKLTNVVNKPIKTISPTNTFLSNDFQKPKTTDCRGISTEALLSVKLKPVNSIPSTKTSTTKNVNVIDSMNNMTLPVKNTGKIQSNFNLDLKSALARRRNKFVIENKENSNLTNLENKNNATNENNFNEKIINNLNLNSSENSGFTSSITNRYRGLSLKESVRENVQTQTKNSEKNHHSPPGGSLGFATKKDSGYTSSRTSLEPSECGDEPQQQIHHHQQQQLINKKESNINCEINANILKKKEANLIENFSLNNSKKQQNSTIDSNNTESKEMMMLNGDNPPPNNRVILISQQIEDHYNDNVNVTQKTFSNQSSNFDNNFASSVNSNNFEKSNNSKEPVNTKPSTENNNDFFNERIENNDPNAFQVRKLEQWTVDDVAHWLTHLQLVQYAKTFVERAITGADLAQFDRARFTQMGVTRIAHRQTMEQSLKNFKIN